MSSLSAYTDSNESDHEAAKRIIASLLQHRSKDEAISSRKLAEHTPVSSSTVRDLIPEIEDEQEIPIGSCPGGYYEITDDDDFRATMESIEETIETKKERQRSKARAYYSKRGESEQ